MHNRDIYHALPQLVQYFYYGLCSIWKFLILVRYFLIMTGEPTCTAWKDRNCAMRLNCHIKSEVSITLCYLLCSACYIAINQEPFKMHLCDQSSHHEKYKQFHYKRKPSHATTKLTLFAVMNGTQRRTLVSPWRMHCTYCGTPPGTSWAEATLNSVKSVLAIIKLC